MSRVLTSAADQVFALGDGHYCVAAGELHGPWSTRGAALAGLAVEQRRAAARRLRSECIVSNCSRACDCEEEGVYKYKVVYGDGPYEQTVCATDWIHYAEVMRQHALGIGKATARVVLAETGEKVEVRP